MESNYDYYKWKITEGLKNNMPELSKLYLLGELNGAAQSKSITTKEFIELRDFMDCKAIYKKYEKEIEFGVYGSINKI